MRFESRTTQNPDRAFQLEWIETNGVGGWASSTIAGANTRREHGLLVAATAAPLSRRVLLSKLDETIESAGERFDLGCNRFPGVIHPRGDRFLYAFERDLFPTFEFRAGGVVLKKTVAAINGENTTVVLYEVLAATSTFVLELRPLVASRSVDALISANGAVRHDITRRANIVRLEPYGGDAFFISAPGAEFIHHGDWYYAFEYEVDEARGRASREDLYTYGVFRVDLHEGSRFGVIISTENPSGRSVEELLHAEEARRVELLERSGATDDVSRQLTLAADQFVIRAGEQDAIVSSYHQGRIGTREALISLPGLCLLSQRFDVARGILTAATNRMRGGLLLLDRDATGEDADYQAVDVPLWLFIAVYRFYEATADAEFVGEQMLPILRDIVARFDEGTLFGIHTDADGLLSAGLGAAPLTWMDTRMGEWAVTPRVGKPVEVNALWYNALIILATLLDEFGSTEESAALRSRAEEVKRKFAQAFWNEHGGYLFDVIGGRKKDNTIRPNQLFALSLPFPLLSRYKSERVLRVVEKKLLTPYGLRTLTSEDPRYRARATGDEAFRSAMHLGSAWPWLFGAYVTATLRMDGDEARATLGEQIREMLYNIDQYGVATIPQLFDGDPPHSPRGPIAHAPAVAEVLRVWVEEIKGP
jgi:glycogen debranching enzyme, archaeal type, putative